MHRQFHQRRLDDLLFYFGIFGLLEFFEETLHFLMVLPKHIRYRCRAGFLRFGEHERSSFDEYMKSGTRQLRMETNATPILYDAPPHFPIGLHRC